MQKDTLDIKKKKSQLDTKPVRFLKHISFQFLVKTTKKIHEIKVNKHQKNKHIQ